MNSCAALVQLSSSSSAAAATSSSSSSLLRTAQTASSSGGTFHGPARQFRSGAGLRAFSLHVGRTAMPLLK